MEWTERDLENWNLYFTFLGSGHITYPQQELVTTQGDLLLLPPKHHRDYRVSDPKTGWGFYFLHFRPAPGIRKALKWFDANKPRKFFVSDPTQRNRIIAALEEMHQINLRTPEIDHRPLLMESLLNSVLLRVAGAQGGVKTSGNGIDPRIEKVLEQIHTNLSLRHSIDAMANKAGLSRSQFCLLFRAGMGRSPQEYLEERRLEAARFYLITTALSVSEIAERVGFDDPFYFSNRFKRSFEKSPSAVRHAGIGRTRRLVSGNSPDCSHAL